MAKTLNMHVQYKKGEKGYQDCKITVSLNWHLHIPKFRTLVKKLAKWIGKMREETQPKTYIVPMGDIHVGNPMK